MYPLANPKVIQRARQILAYEPIFIDTETTGFSPQDVVIEVGVVDLHGATLYETLIKPSIPIPEDAIAIHGIREEMVAELPEWEEAWDELQPLLAGRYIGAYNADFDLRLLKQVHSRHGLVWPLDDRQFFCVMKLYAAFYGQISPLWQQLSLSQARGCRCSLRHPIAQLASRHRRCQINRRSVQPH